MAMIQLGLLWFDDDPRRPLAQKIELAVKRYRERLGRTPEVCQLHPAQATTLAAQKASGLPALRLIPDATLRPNYFLVGTEDETAGIEPAWAAALAERQETSAKQAAHSGAPPYSTRPRARAGARAEKPPVAAASALGGPPTQLVVAASAPGAPSSAKATARAASPRKVAPAPAMQPRPVAKVAATRRAHVVAAPVMPPVSPTTRSRGSGKHMAPVAHTAPVEGAEASTKAAKPRRAAQPASANSAVAVAKPAPLPRRARQRITFPPTPTPPARPTGRTAARGGQLAIVQPQLPLGEDPVSTSAPRVRRRKVPTALPQTSTGRAARAVRPRATLPATKSEHGRESRERPVASPPRPRKTRSSQAQPEPGRTTPRGNSAPEPHLRLRRHRHAS